MRTLSHQCLLVVALSLMLVACGDDGSLPSQPASVADTVYFLRDADYNDERIFDLFLPGQASPHDSITELVLYYEDDIWRNPMAAPCSLYVDPTQPWNHTSLTLSPDMAPYLSEHYTYYNEASCGRHFVVFADRHYRHRALGAFIVVDRYDQNHDFLGKDTIGNLALAVPRLKMLSAGQVMDPTHPVWPLTWRNCYRIPRGVAPDHLELQIRLAPPGQEDSTAFDYRQLSPDSLDEGSFLAILGLDQFDRTGLKVSDGLLDAHDAVFRTDWGLIIFPSRRPFDSDTTFIDAGGAHSAELRLKVPGLYEYTSLNERAQASQYYLLIRIRDH